MKLAITTRERINDNWLIELNRGNPPRPWPDWHSETIAFLRDLVVNPSQLNEYMKWVTERHSASEFELTDTQIRDILSTGFDSLSDEDLVQVATSPLTIYEIADWISDEEQLSEYWTQAYTTSGRQVLDELGLANPFTPQSREAVDDSLFAVGHLGPTSAPPPETAESDIEQSHHKSIPADDADWSPSIPEDMKDEAIEVTILWNGKELKVRIHGALWHGDGVRVDVSWNGIQASVEDVDEFVTLASDAAPATGDTIKITQTYRAEDGWKVTFQVRL